MQRGCVCVCPSRAVPFVVAGAEERLHASQSCIRLTAPQREFISKALRLATDFHVQVTPPHCPCQCQGACKAVAGQGQGQGQGHVRWRR